MSPEFKAGTSSILKVLALFYAGNFFGMWFFGGSDGLSGVVFLLVWTALDYYEEKYLFSYSMTDLREKTKELMEEMKRKEENEDDR